VDNDIKIPNEYLENTDNIDVDDTGIDGKDFNLNYSQNLLELDNSNEYKMPGEEDEEATKVSNSNASIADNKVSESAQAELVNTAPTSDSNFNQVNNQEIAQQESVDDTNNNFNLVLNEIDDKIKNLENLLSNVSSQSNESVFQNNNTNDITAVNDNNFESNTSNVNDITKNFNNENQIVNTSSSQLNKTEQVKNIVNEINELRNLKNYYTSNPKSANVINQNLTNNLFKDEGKVLFDNFTPNLKMGEFDRNEDIVEKEIATNRAVETERAMGGEPKIVKLPTMGEVVIDKKTQSSVEDAVRQHGGLESAINDSVINQKTFNEINNLNESNSNKDVNSNNYTPNFFNKNSDEVTNEIINTRNSKIKNDSISNLIDESTSVNDNTSNLFQNNNNVENLPNTNLNLVKNSNESLAVLNKIFKQLETISNSINKNFNNLVKSITSVSNNQKNYTNVNQSSTNNTNNSSSSMSRGTGNSASDIPEVRGDFPLPDDFPRNFNTEALFSNIRP